MNERSGRNGRSGKNGSSRKTIAVRDGFDDDDNDDNDNNGGGGNGDDDDDDDDDGDEECRITNTRKTMTTATTKAIPRVAMTPRQNGLSTTDNSSLPTCCTGLPVDASGGVSSSA